MKKLLAAAIVLYAALMFLTGSEASHGPSPCYQCDQNADHVVSLVDTAIVNQHFGEELDWGCVADTATLGSTDTPHIRGFVAGATARVVTGPSTASIQDPETGETSFYYYTQDSAGMSGGEYDVFAFTWLDGAVIRHTVPAGYAPGVYTVGIFDGSTPMQSCSLIVTNNQTPSACTANPPALTFNETVTITGTGAVGDERIDLLVSEPESAGEYDLEGFQTTSVNGGWESQYTVDEDHPAGVYEVGVWRLGTMNQGTVGGAVKIAECHYTVWE